MNEIVVPTKLIFHVFGAIAHFERRLIGERTKDGLAAAKAKAKGRKPGRPPVDPDKRDAALKLIEAGLSPTEAARQVGLGRATFYKLRAQNVQAGARRWQRLPQTENGGG